MEGSDNYEKYLARIPCLFFIWILTLKGDRMKALLIALALMLATPAIAQWWNPLESDCSKFARPSADRHCADGKWKERNDKSEKECRTYVEAAA